MKNVVLCYNLYSPRPSEDRKNRVLSVIEKISPDIMGLQEITPTWKQILDENVCDKYAFVGDPREEGRDCEYAPVLYKKEKYECMGYKTYWLSETPEEKSRFEDSKYYRICTVAKLKAKADGAELLFVCLHMDYVHSAAGKQMDALLKILENYEDISISDLCDRMQIPRRAFYRYFISKDGALSALIDHTLMDFYMEEPHDPQDPALGDLKHLFQFWHKHKDLLEALSKNHLAGMMVQRATITAQQENKLPQPFTGLPTHVQQLAMTFTVSGLMAMVFQWHDQGYTVSPTEITKLAISMLTKPLLSKPRKV